jgi:hypothetical protein
MLMFSPQIPPELGPEMIKKAEQDPHTKLQAIKGAVQEVLSCLFFHFIYALKAVTLDSQLDRLGKQICAIKRAGQLIALPECARFCRYGYRDRSNDRHR